MSVGIDPVSLEVIRNGLTSIAEEMSLIVMRSARSPLLREAGDLSSAVTDADGFLVAQGRDVPMHLGVMSFTVREFLKRVPRHRLRPHDVWLLNLPEVGGNHLPDVKAIRPVFADGMIRAFAVSLAHWADTGGALPGSYVPNATDAWQEGLRISPLRIATAEGVDREKLDFVLANVRGPAEREGDILAQLAATRVADERLQQLFAEHGVDIVMAAIAAIHDRAEAQMRDAIAAVPDGVYEGVDWLDDDGSGQERIAIRVRVTISGSEALFDFSDSDEATRGPVNTTPFITAASVFYCMKALLGPDIQPSGGCSPADDDRDPAGLAAQSRHRRAGRRRQPRNLPTDRRRRVPRPRPAAAGAGERGRTDHIGTDPVRRTTARRDVDDLYEVHGGGEGARIDRAGMPALRVHMSNVMNTPAEVIEAEYPIRVERQALRRGSGGRGRHRGGDGLHRAYRIMGPDISVTSMFERRLVPPYGLHGGEPGAPFRVTVTTADGCMFELSGKANIRLNEGDLVVVETCGGGGYGPPDVAADEQEGGARR